MKRFLTLLAALLPMTAPGAGADGSSAASGAQSRGNSGGLGVQLVLTADEHAFRQAWNQPTPPKLKVTRTVRQGASVSALLIFGGCVANAAGVCDLMSEFVLEGPDGSKIAAGGIRILLVATRLLLNQHMQAGGRNRLDHLQTPLDALVRLQQLFTDRVVACQAVHDEGPGQRGQRLVALFRFVLQVVNDVLIQPNRDLFACHVPPPGRVMDTADRSMARGAECH